jgi:response regulator RpfG family c-di-GMP phosphodiesterase
MHPTGNLKLADWLHERGSIGPDRREAALQSVERAGGRIEEALLDVEALDEAALLTGLAEFHRTRFVSTSKLAKIVPNEALLARIPRKVAEQLGLFPVRFDPASALLTVVTPDPDNARALAHAQSLTQAKRVEAFVVRPRALKAAFARHYAGDIHAFSRLEASANPQLEQLGNVFDRQLLEKNARGLELMGSTAELEAAAPTAARGEGATADHLRSLTQVAQVLVGLIEQGREGLRGHSSQVAGLMGKMAERIGIDDGQTKAFVLAAVLHDLGKMSGPHLTALGAGTSESERTRARQLHTAPLRLFEAVTLPAATTSTLTHLYERYDGNGVPLGRKEREIPLGARLLAVIDSYADLTNNAANPFGRVLATAEACTVLGRYAATLFDPHLLELFRHTISGDDLRARLLANRPLALLIEPDAEEAALVELRLVENGFEVRVARTRDRAMQMLQTGEVQVVLAEVKVEGPSDGLTLLEHVRAQSFGAELPWMFFTSSAAPEHASRAFELGTDEYLTKPSTSELLVTKLRKALSRRGEKPAKRGVEGSLEEMGLTEIVQVLWHGRKSGALRLQTAEGQGEIHFVQGQVYNAVMGSKQGTDAFYTLIALKAGRFSLDPSFIAKDQVITENPEGLLLEAMRRLDEGI